MSTLVGFFRHQLVTVASQRSSPNFVLDSFREPNRDISVMPAQFLITQCVIFAHIGA